MNASSTYAERFSFAVACVLGWGVFPAIMLAGGIALLIYASIAEVLSTLAGAAAPIYRDRLAARRAADRLCGPLHP